VRFQDVPTDGVACGWDPDLAESIPLHDTQCHAVAEGAFARSLQTLGRSRSHGTLAIRGQGGEWRAANGSPPRTDDTLWLPIAIRKRKSDATLRVKVQPGDAEGQSHVERVDYESMVIQDLVNAYEREELDISPWYQRRAVWTTAHKSYLINTIFSRMPVPSLYIRHVLDFDNERTIKEVVDGQQRIRSIIEFKANKFSARHPEHDKRVYFDKLTPHEREQFLMAKLPVAYLIAADDSDVIEIFGRLNAVSKTLNPQEKRSAQYSGEFHQFCLRQSASRLAVWREMNLFTANDISRMAEVQYTAELAMAMVSGMTDFSSARINAAYKEWDEDFPERGPITARFDRVFNLIAALKPEQVRGTIFQRSPIFYSLVLVLDNLAKLPTRTELADAMTEIDLRFNDPRPQAERPSADVEFVAACTSSTQRIKSRSTRFKYIKSFF